MPNPIVILSMAITQAIEDLKPTPPTKGPPVPSKLDLKWPKSKPADELAKASGWHF